MGLSIDALVDEMKDVAVNAGSTHNQLLFAVLLIKIWARTQKSLQKDMCALRSLRSTCALAKSTWKKALGLWLTENWSDCEDAPADLSVRRAHILLVLLCPDTVISLCLIMLLKDVKTWSSGQKQPHCVKYINLNKQRVTIYVLLQSKHS